MPTDQEWGRLYNYNTTGDAGLVMPLRSYYIRDFFTTNWSDITLGMIYGGCSASDPMGAIVNEQFDTTATSNLFHFGLSQSIDGGSRIDVENNSSFVGIRGYRGQSHGINAVSAQIVQLIATCNNVIAGSAFSIKLQSGIDATPFSILGIRLTFNPQLSRIYMSISTQNDVLVTNETDNFSTLQTFMVAMQTTIIAPDLSWSIASTANLNTFYIFWPWLLNRFKLQCLALIKYG